MSLQLWSFVAPHGVLELPAIFIAAGAGLRIASGLLFPGCLAAPGIAGRAGREAVQLLLGCVPILFVAGIIEAFLSPTELAIPMKFLFAAAMFTLLVLYLFGLSVALRLKLIPLLDVEVGVHDRARQRCRSHFDGQRAALPHSRQQHLAAMTSPHARRPPDTLRRHLSVRPRLRLPEIRLPNHGKQHQMLRTQVHGGVDHLRSHGCLRQVGEPDHQAAALLRAEQNADGAQMIGFRRLLAHVNQLLHQLPQMRRFRVCGNMRCCRPRP